MRRGPGSGRTFSPPTRQRRAPGAWRALPRLLAAGTAAVAVAAVVVAALVIPSANRVTPRVPALSDSHAVRTSVSDEPVSQLAALSMVTPFRK